MYASFSFLLSAMRSLLKRGGDPFPTTEVAMTSFSPGGFPEVPVIRGMGSALVLGILLLVRVWSLGFPETGPAQFGDIIGPHWLLNDSRRHCSPQGKAMHLPVSQLARAFACSLATAHHTPTGKKLAT